VATPSFPAAKAALDTACASLRGFTLGHPGFTQRDGAAGIQQVRALCDRLCKRFAAGPDAARATAAAHSGRTRARAAQSRLDLLRRAP
jgi:hypothetical protein